MTKLTVDRAALESCSREPIHIPGAIQPHGALLVLEDSSLRCLQVSANIQEMTGWDSASFHDADITNLLGDEAERFRDVAKLPDPLQECPITLSLPAGKFDCLIHRHDGLLIVELEPAPVGQRPLYHRQLQMVFAAMRSNHGEAALFKTMAQFVAELTGYERVMVYRFDADWHGEVVGEHLLTNVDSYFGHHFPASDIPEQARALYTRSWLRIIPNSTYTPVPLEPALNPLSDRPTDLSFSVLRSVSPIHLEYLRNMDVGASMSISLIINGKLWGLIACHHRTPRPLPYAVRAACEIFGQVSSLEIAAQQEGRLLREHVEATRIQTRFFDIISNEQNYVEALIKYTPELLAFMNAKGAALNVNGSVTLLGETPSEEQVSATSTWLQSQEVVPILTTDALSLLWPDAAAFKPIGSGLLAIKLSQVQPDYLMFFRPEVLTTVTWAGNPDKKLDPGEILHPRKSFAAWEQTVTGHSYPWTETERQGARELRSAINALVLRRNQLLLKENGELEKKNTDLNSFAYIASHDLKEPLRGIAHYTSFTLEDYGKLLPEEGVRRLTVIGKLADHCEELLGALRRFSRVGRMELELRDVSADEVLDRALSSMEMVIKDNHVEIRRPASLPEIRCDAVLMREVFQNLIGNAICYNKNVNKMVEVGALPRAADTTRPVFYVKDNGIGIKDKHHDAIFTIFRRLHAQGAFGNGTGAGLAITRSIIERHGGRIWVESKPDEGATFFFTLS